MGLNPDNDVIALEEDEEKLFDEVYNVYGEYSAIGLMNLTHQEAPWKNIPTGIGNIISQKALEEFFKTRVE